MKVDANFPVTIYGNATKFSEVTSLARCRIFYRGANRNGTYISDEFAEKLISTLPYTPIKGIFDSEEKNFLDHGWSNTDGRVYGIVPQNPNFAWEKFEDEDGVEREYACADVIIFTALYPEANHIVGKAQSMELYRPSIKGEWKNIDGTDYFEFTEGCFLGLQILGTVDGVAVEPCFEGASFFSLITDMNLLLSNLKTETDNKSGGKRMFKFELEDSNILTNLWIALNGEEDDKPIRYSISQIFDEYALAYDYKESVFCKVYYTLNEDKLEITGTVNCKNLILTDTAYESIENLKNGNDGKYEGLYDYYTNTINALNDAKTELENQLTAVTTERDELVTYKKNIEDENKKTLIDSYRAELGDAVEPYEEDMDKYSYVDLDKELAYTLHNQNKKKNITEELPTGNDMSSLDMLLNQYKK